MLIVLDTNLLPRQGNLRNVSISTLLRVAGTLSSTVAITSTVLSESINARRHDAQEALDRHAKAVSDLSKYCQIDSYYVPSVESIVREWKDDLEETFVVLPLDGEDAKEALLREAMRRKPAKADGTGARDSAIWLCIKRRHLKGAHATHFASNNTGDFGAKKGDPSLHPDLLWELGDRAEDFHYHTSVNSVIEKLCARTQVSITLASFPEDALLSIVEQVVAHQDLTDFPDFVDRSPEDFGPIESLELAEMRVRSAYSAGGVTVGFLTASFVMPLAVDVHETLGTSVSGRLGGWFELADDAAIVRFDVTLLKELARNRH